MRALLNRLTEAELSLLAEPEELAPLPGDAAVYVRLLADARAEFGDGHPFVTRLAQVLAGWGVATEWPAAGRPSRLAS